MLPVNKKQKTIILLIGIFLILIAIAFYFNYNEYPEDYLTNSVRGEIVDVSESNRSLTIQIKSPAKLEGKNILIETDSETEFRGFPSTEGMMLKDDGTVSIMFSDFSPRDSIIVNYSSEVDISQLPHENKKPEKIIVEKEIDIITIDEHNRTSRDLAGVVLEKREDTILLGVTIPHWITGMEVEIDILPETEFRVFTRDTDPNNFKDSDLPEIDFSEIPEGDHVHVYTLLHRVEPEVREGKIIPAELVRWHPRLTNFPEDIRFWANNLYGSISEIKAENRIVTVDGLKPPYFKGKDQKFNIENAEIRKFYGTGSEFRDSFRDMDFSELDIVDFEDLSVDDFAFFSLSSEDHYIDQLHKEVIDVDKIIVVPDLD